MNIYKDYQLKDGILYKPRIIESKHLMWQFGGVPCISADLWDKIELKINRIKFITDKGRIFETTKEEFNLNRRELNYSGFGRQYYMEKEYWTIKQPTFQEKLMDFSKQCL